MNTSSQHQFNNQVAAIRAVSVLAVIGYHFFPSYFSWGYLGVDGFFVISGFLMIPLIARSKNFVNFINNRIKRLYPALLILVVLFVVLGYLFLLDDEYNILLQSSIGSLLHVQNVLESSREGYFVETIGFRPYLNIWSLAVEFQVYLIMGLILLVLLRNQSLINKIRFLSTLFLISIVGYMIMTYSYGQDPFFISPLRIWEFFSGSLLYYFMSSTYAGSLLRVLKRTCMPYIILIVIGLFILFYGGELKGISTFLSVIFCVLFIYVIDLSKMPKFVRRSYLYIGSISYSVYLFHYPAKEFLERFVGVPSVGEKVLIICITFVVAHIVDLVMAPRIAGFHKAGAKLFLGSIVLSGFIVLLWANLDVLNRSIIVKNSIVNTMDSFEISYNDKCSFIGEESYGDERCRIGRGLDALEEPRFIIIGDSLSNSMTTMFESLADFDHRFSDYLQIGKGYCPIVFDFGDDDCKRFRNDVIALLKKYENVPIIITAQWPLYFYARDVDIFDGRKNELFNFIQERKNNGSMVYLAHSVPLGARPRSCMARFPWSSLGGCDVPYSTFSQRGDFAHSALEKIAREAGVLIFDPAKYMCDTVACAVYRAGKIFYLDDSHLTVDGGKYLAKESEGWWYENFIQEK